MGKLSSHWYIQTWDWNLLKETKPRLHSPCTGSEVSASKLQKSGRSPIEVEVSYIPWFTRVFCLFRCWLITKFPINREFLLVLLIIVKLATKINPATTTAHLTLRGAVPGPTGFCHPTSHQIWKKENSKFQSKSSFGASMFKISKVNVYMYIYITLQKFNIERFWEYHDTLRRTCSQEIPNKFPRKKDSLDLLKPTCPLSLT